MPADGNGRERIIDGEFARRRNLRADMDQSLGIKGDPEFSGNMDQLQIIGVQVIAGTEPESLDLAGMAFQDLLHMGIIAIENTDFALLEQKALAMQILLKAGMLIRPDMVGRQIRKQSYIVENASRSVHHKGLGGHLHNDCLCSGIRHFL